MSKTIKSYKGMDKNMQCKGFQYEVGKTYETDKAVVCQCGFHACEAPLNVWDYYPPIDGNRFFEVEQSGKLSKHTGDSKVASTKLKVGAEIGIPGLVKAHVEWVKEQVKDATDAAQIGSSGRYAKIGSSGDAAQIGSSGRYAQIGSSGDAAKVVCEAENAVVACVGMRGKIKAPIGTWITLAEYGEWDGEGYPCICVKSARIDGDVLKPNVFYTLRNGEFVEVSDE